MNFPLQIEDMYKRLSTIENILLEMTGIIDIATLYENRLQKLESKSNTRKLKMEQTKKYLKTDAANYYKTKLIENVNLHYSNFIACLKKLPIQEDRLIHGYYHLDDGMNWIIDQIRRIEIFEDGELSKQTSTEHNTNIEINQTSEEIKSPINDIEQEPIPESQL